MSTPKKYRPSNGTEGDCFMAEHCWKCRHWKNNKAQGFDYCRKNIQEMTMGYDTDDEEYPAEWTYTKDGKPTCTAFEAKGVRPIAEHKRKDGIVNFWLTPKSWDGTNSDLAKMVRSY